MHGWWGLLIWKLRHWMGYPNLFEKCYSHKINSHTNIVLGDILDLFYNKSNITSQYII